MLNIHEQQELQRLASNWRLTPATMATKLTKGKWIAAPWLQYVSTRVAHAIAKGNGRLIISAPPRHGKSELISVHTPTWVLENFPRKNIILTGYGAELTEIYGRRVRDQIRENSHLLRCRVRSDVSKVSAFLTETDGYMFSVGLGGAITGRGAHVLLIDDYIKEIKEALSPAHRDYLWNWFVTTAMTRLEPGATVIIIATRWHSDDLIGRVLKNYPGKWENICLPAEALENDLLKRPVGAPLFPERYDLEALQAQKDLLGSVFYHALYQQGPVDEILKMTNPDWIPVIDTLPAEDFRWIRVWDLAATQDGGDYACGTLCGFSKSTGEFVIANILRKQLSVGNLESLVRSTAVADGMNVSVGIEREPGSAGIALVNHYDVTVLPEYKVVAIPASKAKLIRAQPFLAAAEAGKVKLYDERAYVPSKYEDTMKWHDTFKKEFEDFPGGANDDQIDTAAAGYVYLTGKKVLSTAPFRKPAGYKENSQKIRQASFSLSRPKRIASKVTFGRRAR